MATEKPSYTPTQWKNENEGGDTPDINAENLNHIEQGLKDIYDYAIEKLLNNDDFVSKLAERIVNTGTTSEAGYAADARQLNPNQSGSLAQQITQLKSDLISKFQSLADYKNQGVVGTVSNCWINTIGHIAIADFGLFLVSQHLGESDVVVFTIPAGFRPSQVAYGVMSSTDGEFSTKVSAEISGEIKLSRTPSTAKYLGGQVIFLIN